MRPSSPHECGEPDGAPPNAKVDLRPDRPVPGTNMILDITSAPPEFDEVQLIRREHPTHSLELKLSRGTVLHVEGQVEGAKHIQLSPTRPRRPAKLIGCECRFDSNATNANERRPQRWTYRRPARSPLW